MTPLTAVCTRKGAADVSICVNDYEKAMRRLQQEETAELITRIRPG